MSRFLLRRAAGAVLALLVSTFVIYSGLYLSPGSPLSTLTGGRPVGPATAAALRAQYHLSDPFLERYIRWMGDVLQGRFGTSFVSQGESVATLIGSRIGTTVMLIAMSAFLIVVLGVALGVIAALYRGKIAAVVTAVTSVGMAIPSFVAASVLITLFSVQFGWFPVFGSGSGFTNRLWHLTLPSFALAIAGIAYVSLTTHGAVVRELEADHVMTARARGLPNLLIVRKHVLRNAAIPITTVTGLMVAYLLVGTAIVETAFNLNGIGSLLVSSVTKHDFPVVQAVCLILVMAFILINFCIDLLYVRLDPRITLW